MTPTDRPDSERDAALRARDERAAELSRRVVDAARTPLDQPEAVAWQWRRRDWPADRLWRDGTPKQCQAYREHFDHEYEVRALGVLPFTASPDCVRREALEEAASVLRESAKSLHHFDACILNGLAKRIVGLATKGQS